MSHPLKVGWLSPEAANKHLYVGYGDDETAAIGIVDTTSNKRLDEEYKTRRAPQSLFQLEASGPNIFVNLPDLKPSAVINRKRRAITRWTLTLDANFPMALGEADHRLFIASRVPAGMAMFDTESGHNLATLPCGQDSDDLYYDQTRRRVYVTVARDRLTSLSRMTPITTDF